MSYIFHSKVLINLYNYINNVKEIFVNNLNICLVLAVITLSRGIFISTEISVTETIYMKKSKSL